MFQENGLDRTGEDIESMRFLLKGVIQALVDSQDNVAVEAVSDVAGTVLLISVAPADLGKVIGKQGRTARSLRTILSAASMKIGHRFSMDVREAV